MSENRLPDDEARFEESESSDSHHDGPTEAPKESTDSSDESPWAAIKPWKGKAARLDKVLLFLIIGVPLVYLGLMPLRPWMLVNAPVLQEFINGAKTAVVAAGAYARVGEIPLWLVIVAGFIGMAKLDWAFWLRRDAGATEFYGSSPKTSDRSNASNPSSGSRTGRSSS